MGMKNIMGFEYHGFEAGILKYLYINLTDET